MPVQAVLVSDSAEKSLSRGSGSEWEVVRVAMYYSIYLEAVVERIVELVRYGPPPAQERLVVYGVLGLAELEF